MKLDIQGLVDELRLTDPMMTYQPPGAEMQARLVDLCCMLLEATCSGDYGNPTPGGPGRGGGEREEGCGRLLPCLQNVVSRPATTLPPPLSSLLTRSPVPVPP